MIVDDRPLLLYMLYAITLGANNEQIEEKKIIIMIGWSLDDDHWKLAIVWWESGIARSSLSPSFSCPAAHPVVPFPFPHVKGWSVGRSPFPFEIQIKLIKLRRDTDEWTSRRCVCLCRSVGPNELMDTSAGMVYRFCVRLITYNSHQIMLRLYSLV